MHAGYSSTNGGIPAIVSNLANRGLCPGMINSSGRDVAWSGGIVTPAPTNLTTATNPPTVTNPPGTGGNITVRARGAVGGEQIEIRVNNVVVGTFIMSASCQDCNVSGSGTVRMYFTNDNGSDYDVRIDYADIDGVRQQAEKQAANTAV